MLAEIMSSSVDSEQIKKIQPVHPLNLAYQPIQQNSDVNKTPETPQKRASIPKPRLTTSHRNRLLSVVEDRPDDEMSRSGTVVYPISDVSVSRRITEFVKS